MTGGGAPQLRVRGLGSRAGGARVGTSPGLRGSHHRWKNCACLVPGDAGTAEFQNLPSTGSLRGQTDWVFSAHTGPPTSPRLRVSEWQGSSKGHLHKWVPGRQLPWASSRGASGMNRPASDHSGEQGLQAAARPASARGPLGAPSAKTEDSGHSTQRPQRQRSGKAWRCWEGRNLLWVTSQGQPVATVSPPLICAEHRGTGMLSALH